ncbi:MAG: terminase small subunit [Candidatus Saccharibacteria bacterium]|nr:terminase small subunit [Rhodoferax sp.]
MKMHKDRLTERQRLFCEMYVGTGRHCAALAARLAGYAPGCSHVTGCQLLKKPKIAATVRGLEEALAREIGVSRQAVIAQLLGAADLARELREPASMISAYRNVAQICGYYRQEEVAAAPADAGGLVMERLRGMSDQELIRMVEAGA